MLGEHLKLYNSLQYFMSDITFFCLT